MRTTRAAGALLAIAVGAAALPAGGCRADGERAAAAAPEGAREAEREAMVREQLVARGIHDARVLQAMRTVPRHRFVPEPHRARAYADTPLPIGRGQTISQPYVVAFMAEALALRGTERILEVGSGSGYALAVLSLLGAEAWGIELEPELHDRSAVTLHALGYRNVHLRAGDGFRGWPEAAPFDAIVLSCATEEVPPPLWDQLAEGGRLILPAGPEGGEQELVLRVKTREGARERRLLPVRFVPMRPPPGGRGR